jgi:hypothetical protein
MALVFWKDSLDFNRIIRQQLDHVEAKSNAPGFSPEKSRISTYRKAAEDAIQNYKAGGGGSRSAFGSNGGVFNQTGTSMGAFGRQHPGGTLGQGNFN